MWRCNIHLHLSLFKGQTNFQDLFLDNPTLALRPWFITFEYFWIPLIWNKPHWKATSKPMLRFGVVITYIIINLSFSDYNWCLTTSFQKLKNCQVLFRRLRRIQGLKASAKLQSNTRNSRKGSPNYEMDQYILFTFWFIWSLDDYWKYCLDIK